MVRGFWLQVKKLSDAHPITKSLFFHWKHFTEILKNQINDKFLNEMNLLYSVSLVKGVSGWTNSPHTLRFNVVKNLRIILIFQHVIIDSAVAPHHITCEGKERRIFLGASSNDKVENGHFLWHHPIHQIHFPTVLQSELNKHEYWNHWDRTLGYRT